MYIAPPFTAQVGPLVFLHNLCQHITTAASKGEKVFRCCLSSVRLATLPASDAAHAGMPRLSE